MTKNSGTPSDNRSVNHQIRESFPAGRKPVAWKTITDRQAIPRQMSNEAYRAGKISLLSDRGAYSEEGVQLTGDVSLIWRSSSS